MQTPVERLEGTYSVLKASISSENEGSLASEKWDRQHRHLEKWVASHVDLWYELIWQVLVSKLVVVDAVLLWEASRRFQPQKNRNDSYVHPLTLEAAVHRVV